MPKAKTNPSLTVPPVAMRWSGDVFSMLASISSRLRFLALALDSATLTQTDLSGGELGGAADIADAMADEVLAVIEVLKEARALSREVPA